MTGVENTINKPPIKNETYRVVHPASFAIHDAFLRSLKEALTDIPRAHANIQRFPDGSPNVQFIVGDGTVRSKEDFPITAIVPYWLIDAGGYSVRELFTVLLETLDALSGTIDKMPYAKKIIVASPYLSVRTDHGYEPQKLYHYLV